MLQNAIIIWDITSVSPHWRTCTIPPVQSNILLAPVLVKVLSWIRYWYLWSIREVEFSLTITASAAVLTVSDTDQSFTSFSNVTHHYYGVVHVFGGSKCKCNAKMNDIVSLWQGHMNLCRASFVCRFKIGVACAWATFVLFWTLPHPNALIDKRVVYV